MLKSDFELAINSIITDNTSGSLSIVEKLILTFEAYLESDDFDALFLVDQLLIVYFKFPHFGVLFHFLNKVFLEIEKHQNKSKVEQKETLKLFLKSYKINFSAVIENISENLLKSFDLNEKTILVHSNSSTVKDVFVKIIAKAKIKEMIQTVSYPAKEGILQAEQFANENIKVNLIPDAAIFRFVKLSDVIILGADLIFEEFFLNKVGTQSIVIAANYFQKPVFVLSDSRKIIPHHKLNQTLIKSFLNEKDKPAKEIYEGSNSNIKPLNFYFERTPSNLVTSFITEKGVFNSGKIYSATNDLNLSPFFSTI